jgi:DNA repair protein SbcD/Mre11
MFRFIHAADLHLDSPLRGLDLKDAAPGSTIREAPRRALEALVQLCHDEAVKFLLIAGDIYDGDWKDFATGHFFCQQMRKLGDTPVLMIRGNHDAANKMTRSLPLPKNVTVLGTSAAETHVLSRQSVAVHGRSFADRETRENLVRDYPPPVSGCFNIGLLHTSLAGAETRHDRYAPCSEAQLVNAGYDYWALGHIHERRVVRAVAPTVVFPGNLQGRHVRETGPKGAYLVTVDDTGAVALEFRRLDVAQWEVIELRAGRNEDREDVLDSAVEAARVRAGSETDRLLVVRYLVSGQTRAHSHLQARSGETTEILREMLCNEYGERVWLESVHFDTAQLTEDESPADPDAATAEFRAVVDDLRSDPQLLESVSKSLTALQDKLPFELRNGEDALKLTDTTWLASMLGRVVPVLADAASPGNFQ